mmetsp:Transcript_132601/g.255456  ORF Transcript_132601/g.255456 Transcript_132601/m.255456 type:complete len:222 (+) Transcript_132601:642-1307(+)
MASSCRSLKIRSTLKTNELNSMCQMAKICSIQNGPIVRASTTPQNDLMYFQRLNPTSSFAGADQTLKLYSIVKMMTLAISKPFKKSSPKNSMTGAMLSATTDITFKAIRSIMTDLTASPAFDSGLFVNISLTLQRRGLCSWMLFPAFLAALACRITFRKRHLTTNECTISFSFPWKNSCSCFFCSSRYASSSLVKPEAIKPIGTPTIATAEKRAMNRMHFE